MIFKVSILKRAIFFGLTMILFFLFVTCKKAPPDAPEITTRITGRVTDGKTNQPLAGVQISTSPITATFITESDGIYTIPNVLAGQYSITATKNGYNAATKIVTVQEGKTVNGDLQLYPIGPELSVSNQFLDFDLAQTVLAFNITNKTSIGMVTWQISYNQSWIDVSPSSGTTTTESDQVTVTVNRDSVAYGNHMGIITVFSDYGIKYINVLMTKQNPSSPQLTVTPTSIDFGASVENAQLVIKNTGTGVLNWTASKNVNWLLFSTTLGSCTPGNPSTLTIYLDKSGLAANNYEGTVIIGSNGGNQSIEIKMQVDKQTFNNPPIANFTVTPSYGTTSTNFTFDASSSTDDNDPIDLLSVRWKWDNNLSFTEWTTNKNATYAYDYGSDKVVTLEVKDTKGKVGSTSKTVKVLQGEIEPNNSKLQAQKIELNSSIAGEIGYSGDTEDWFEIFLQTNGGFTFSISNLNPSSVTNGKTGSVYLYDDYSNQLSSIGYLNPGTSATSNTYSVSRNEHYYIRVTSYNSTNSAPYKLTCSGKYIDITDIGEPNNNKLEAYPISVSSTIVASIGYGNDAEDWYVLTFTKNGTFSYNFSNLHESNIANGRTGSVYFYNANSTQLLSTGYLKPGTSVTSDTANVSPETYYLKIVRYNTTHSAPYRLKLNFN